MWKEVRRVTLGMEALTAGGSPIRAGVANSGEDKKGRCRDI